ncbi:serine hydrolase domain-containing protein [Cohnella hashimotonis]|uniref:Serine hydrolase domain-containing protein n=1 Tax=Cohnella hashimotonis TaxID=2826895 RepID=A0ABT6THP5_9BACL|nr:serine hydrolase domain-containing protein [Cohnella hashimotonis]MDI4646363.1 serine hydrolase domain-containing protein [Cohnella hashimotonis]
MSTYTFRHVDALLKRFVDQGLPGCSCSVVRRGETVYEGFAGYADLATRRPIGPDTIFRLFSMTKVITCTAALMLYERGFYLLNDPLSEYLSEFRHPSVYRQGENGTLYTSPAVAPIQVKHLFMMASGLTMYGDRTETERQVSKLSLKEIPDLRSFAKRLADIPLAFDPGTRWHYGFSHDMLGALIEVLSGKPFGQFLKEEIFEPLGMHDTFFRIPEDKKDRLTTLYAPSEEGPTPNMENEWLNRQDTTIEFGGHGLLSTLRDYGRFTQMLARGGELDGARILGRKTIELMATDHLDARQRADMALPGTWPGYGYGLGVRVMTDRAKGGSNSTAGEFGWAGAAGSWMAADLEEELSVVYMQGLLPKEYDEIRGHKLRAAIYSAL